MNTPNLLVIPADTTAQTVLTSQSQLYLPLCFIKDYLQLHSASLKPT